MDALLRRRIMMMTGEAPTPPGPTPTQPVFYDLLVFDGTAYIDTDYYYPQNCSIRVSLGNETNKTQQRVFLIGNATDGYLGLLYGGNTNNTRRQLVPYYDSTNYLSPQNNINFSSHPRFPFFMTPLRYGYNNTSWTYTKGNTRPNAPLVLGSNSNHNGDAYSGKMGVFYAYGSDAQNVTSYSGFDSYTPVATFRPCTYDGEAGMWYVEGSRFFGNTAGGGTLTVENNS